MRPNGGSFNDSSTPAPAPPASAPAPSGAWAARSRGLPSFRGQGVAQVRAWSPGVAARQPCGHPHPAHAVNSTTLNASNGVSAPVRGQRDALPFWTTPVLAKNEPHDNHEVKREPRRRSPEQIPENVPARGREPGRRNEVVPELPGAPIGRLRSGMPSSPSPPRGDKAPTAQRPSKCASNTVAANPTLLEMGPPVIQGLSSDRSLPVLLPDQRWRFQDGSRCRVSTPGTGPPVNGGVSCNVSAQVGDIVRPMPATSVGYDGDVSPIPMPTTVSDLQLRLKDLQQQLAASNRIAAHRASEAGELLARVSERDAEISRLRGPHRSGSALSSSRDVLRIAALEAENTKLRGQRNALPTRAREENRESSDGEARHTSRDDAARRLQRMWRSSHARRRGGARDGWKRTLQEVEDVVSRALQRVIQPNSGRVPKQARLQLLANVLKQNVVKVNHEMMQQALQDLRKSTASSPRPLSPLGSL